MEPFNTVNGIVATLDRANVDTDQIIPKQFLKSIKRTGFGESLFFDWRYGDDGKPDPQFELNDPALAGAVILVTRNNFGCGSSREHAVWAVAQYGFRVVIAPWQDRNGSRVPGFADIFANNCIKNGVLTIELSEAEVDEIFAAVAAAKGVQATVDLGAQQVIVHTATGDRTYAFEVDPVKKEHLQQGLDDIAMTLAYADDITQFEQTHPTRIAAT